MNFYEVTAVKLLNLLGRGDCLDSPRRRSPGASRVAEVASDLYGMSEKVGGRLWVSALPGLASCQHGCLDVVGQPRLRRLEQPPRRADGFGDLPRIEVGAGERPQGQALEGPGLRPRLPELERLGAEP
jgi:hypothetical protein